MYKWQQVKALKMRGIGIKRGTLHRDIPALKKLSSWPDLSSILKESERISGERTSETRRVALYLSHRLSGLSLGEIGKYFGGIDPSAVSQNTRRLEGCLKEDTKLSREIDRLKKILDQ